MRSLLRVQCLGADGPYREIACMAIEPWLVEAALARLGRTLSPAEQRTTNTGILFSTRFAAAAPASLRRGAPASKLDCSDFSPVVWIARSAFGVSLLDNTPRLRQALLVSTLRNL